MYTTIQELSDAAVKRQLPLWRIVLENEMQRSECTEQSVWEQLAQRYQIMKDSVQAALSHGLPTTGGLIDGIASGQYAHASGGQSICGSFINLVMARALSGSECNAAMGKICAAPTAGSCGIIPAVLLSVGEQYGRAESEVLKGLLTASGLGAVVMRNATVAGAKGGCQAECGVAAAMAAAAAVQLAGGSDKQALNSFCFALMNCMGLICDPIAGLVQVPCAQRNASQAVNALISADMALSNMVCPIPPDEMVEAMYRVGKMLPPALRETALGGIAATPAGKAITARIMT